MNRLANGMSPGPRASGPQRPPPTVSVSFSSDQLPAARFAYHADPGGHARTCGTPPASTSISGGELPPKERIGSNVHPPWEGVRAGAERNAAPGRTTSTARMSWMIVESPHGEHVVACSEADFSH